MKVTLINWPQYPLRSIHCAVENMNGNMIHDITKVSVEKAMNTVKNLSKTRLNSALEFGGDYFFQIEGVSRAFTHQMVRNRIGATYSQESMRFVDKNPIPVKIPESFNPQQSEIFISTMSWLQNNYERLLALGASVQDCRDMLPIGTLTKIGVRYNFMTLLRVCEVRLCYQSQAHWYEAARQFKTEISEKCNPHLAELLVKACERSGECEFRSVYDRDCPHREDD